MSARSTSRGRDSFQSSGRGGFGNIHTAADDIRPADGPDDFSPTRGREPRVQHEMLFRSTGRGGAGNLRSTSREPSMSAGTDAREQEILKHEADKSAAMFSTGRGGLGNISRSRSRGPTPGGVVGIHSTGRGGVGNMFEGDGTSIETVLENENFKYQPAPVHSTGRGGAANLSHSPAPAVEPAYRASPGASPSPFESTGRGGAGNMRDRSASREVEAARSQSRGRVADILHRVAHPLEKSSRERGRLGDNPSVERGRATGPAK